MWFSLSNTYNSSSYIENCSNNGKSQPKLNFYILPSDQQRRRCWLQAIGWAQQCLKFLHFSLVDQISVCKEHTGPPSPPPSPSKCICSFNRLWCRSLSRIRASTELFIKKFFFRWSLHFSVFESPNKNSSKQVHVISTAYHSFPIPQNKSRRQIYPVINN